MLLRRSTSLHRGWSLSTQLDRSCYDRPRAVGRVRPCAVERQGSGGGTSTSSPSPAEPTPSRLAVAEPLESIGSMDAVNPLPSFDFFEAQICSAYRFDESQLHVISELRQALVGCMWAYGGVAVANIALSVSHAAEGLEEGAAGVLAGLVSELSVGDVAYWGDSLMVVALIWFALQSFNAVLEDEGKVPELEMAHTFQAVNRLALVFQQLSIGSLAVTTVTALEAAATYPGIVPFMSSLFFGLAGLRSLALWYTLSRYNSGVAITRALKELRGERCTVHPALERQEAGKSQPSALDKVMVALALGFFLEAEREASEASKRTVRKVAEKSKASLSAALSMSSMDLGSLASPSSSTSSSAALASGDAHGALGGKAAARKQRPYEFSPAEERILKTMTESANTAGLALAVQALATFMLTVADYGTGEMSGVVSNGINLVNKATMATLLLGACTRFDRALHTSGGDDVGHLMEGLGEHGLTELFKALSTLAVAVVLASLLGLVIPTIEESPLFTGMGDAASHGMGEVLVEGLSVLKAVLQGL